MQDKPRKGSATPVPRIQSDAAAIAATSLAPVPARGLSAAFDAALGGKARPSQIAESLEEGGRSARFARADQVNKAPKPVANAQKAQSPRKGHR
jgi:hypothetical protein